MVRNWCETKEARSATISTSVDEIRRWTHSSHAHLVGSESSSLVRADNVRASEGLDAAEGKEQSKLRREQQDLSESDSRRQIPDNGSKLRHLLSSESETDSDDSSESFGDGSDSESDGDLSKGRRKRVQLDVVQLDGRQTAHTHLEVVDSSLEKSSVRRIGEVSDVDEPDENTDDGDDFGERVSELIELPLEGSSFGGSGSDGIVDLTDGSPLPSKNDDRES